MKRASDTTAPIPPESVGPYTTLQPVIVLAMLWAPLEPYRVGQVAPLPGFGQDWTFGRDDRGEERRMRFHCQEPGRFEFMGALESASLSREQGRLRTIVGGLKVVRNPKSKRRMFVNGIERDEAVLMPGDTLYIEGVLLLYCTRRVPGPLPPLEFFPSALLGAVGEPDGIGILGGSPLVWTMRGLIAVIARVDKHVLILGESGTGKELAANGIHQLSSRADGPLVERDAGTFVDTLMDAELRGNRKSFPNVGSPEQIGMFGEANGGTLFLDEIGNLPMDLQEKLLRVLAVGKYTRLGETKTRHSDFRLIGAMNRPLSALKEDLLYRLKLRLKIPSLAERREDIPLLARHLLLKIADENPEIAGRFVEQWPGGRREVRFDGLFVDSLVRRRYRGNVRELAEVLMREAITQRGNTLKGPIEEPDEDGEEGDDAPARKASGATRPVQSPGGEADEGTGSANGDGDVELTKEQVVECLNRNQWLLDPAAAELGLTNRYALRRRMIELGIKLRKR